MEPRCSRLPLLRGRPSAGRNLLSAREGRSRLECRTPAAASGGSLPAPTSMLNRWCVLVLVRPGLRFGWSYRAMCNFWIQRIFDVPEVRHSLACIHTQCRLALVRTGAAHEPHVPPSLPHTDVRGWCSLAAMITHSNQMMIRSCADQGFGVLPPDRYRCSIRGACVDPHLGTAFR